MRLFFKETYEACKWSIRKRNGLVYARPFFRMTQENCFIISIIYQCIVTFVCAASTFWNSFDSEVFALSLPELTTRPPPVFLINVLRFWLHYLRLTKRGSGVKMISELIVDDVHIMCKNVTLLFKNITTITSCIGNQIYFLELPTSRTVSFSTIFQSMMSLNALSSFIECRWYEKIAVILIMVGRNFPRSLLFENILFCAVRIQQKVHVAIAVVFQTSATIQKVFFVFHSKQSLRYANSHLFQIPLRNFWLKF